MTAHHALTGKATTMGHIQRHHLDEPVLSAAEAVDHLDCDLGPLWDRALAAEIESLTLAELRELLLPKVMSGEIRVRDAEKVVEEAL
jgi:type I restriction enzyme S subunit